MSQNCASDGEEAENNHILSPGEAFTNGYIYLNLAKGFVGNWKTSEGFRDLFQNCRDGVIKSFNIKRNDLIFEPPADSKLKYEIRVFSQTVQRYVAYIRFNKDRKSNYETGTIDMTNYQASIARENLSIGASTKRKNADMAGAHGEGLKAATLVMTRNEHPITINTSGFYLKFKFKPKLPEEFVCQVVKSRKEKNLGEIQEKNLSSVLPKADIYRDVSVIIEGVEFSEFKDWLKLCLDFEGPLDMINTSFGDVILNPELSGKVYVKSFLIQDYNLVETSTGAQTAPAKQLKYGYNLLGVEVDRDRHSLIGPKEEEKRIVHIWWSSIFNEANLPQAEKKAVKRFVELLLDSDERRWADLQNIESYHLGDIMSDEIWKYLRQIGAGRDFYYGPGNADRDVGIIRESLNQNPVSLPSSIWKPLRQSGLVRTPQEEQRHLLRTAIDTSVKSNPYAETVHQMLLAAFCLSEKTQSLRILCKAGNRADLDLLLDGSTVLIHERWFDFYDCHAWSPCQISESSSTGSVEDYNRQTFLCDHVVVYLYGLLLKQLELDSCYGGRTTINRQLCTTVSECLAQMPRDVQLEPGSERGTLVVCWLDFASERASLNGLKLECRIVLHESTCQMNSEKFLARKSISEMNYQLNVQDKAECGCPRKIVLQKDSRACFSDLDTEKEYYPTVASQSAKAFYAPPPKSKQPRQDESNSAESIEQLTATSAIHDTYQDQIDEYTYDENIYDVNSSHHGSDDMDLDVDSCQAGSAPGFDRSTTPTRDILSPTTTSDTGSSDMNKHQFSCTLSRSTSERQDFVGINPGTVIELQKEQRHTILRDNETHAAISEQQSQGVSVGSEIGSGNAHSDTIGDVINRVNAIDTIAQQQSESAPAEAAFYSNLSTPSRSPYLRQSRNSQQQDARSPCHTHSHGHAFDQATDTQILCPEASDHSSINGEELHQLSQDLQAEATRLHIQMSSLCAENARLSTELEEARRRANAAFERGQKLKNEVSKSMAMMSSTMSMFKALSSDLPEPHGGEVVDAAGGSGSVEERHETGSGEGHVDQDGDVLSAGLKRNIGSNENLQEGNACEHVEKRVRLS